MHNLGQQRAQGESVNSYHLCLAGLKKNQTNKTKHKPVTFNLLGWTLSCYTPSAYPTWYRRMSSICAPSWQLQSTNRWPSTLPSKQIYIMTSEREEVRLSEGALATGANQQPQISPRFTCSHACSTGDGSVRSEVTCVWFESTQNTKHAEITIS